MQASVIPKLKISAVTAMILAAATVCTMFSSCAKPAEPTIQEADPIYKLWYTQPAEESGEGFEKWSLPIGNGYMGVSVFGGTEYELLSINENSMFNPPNWGSNYGATTGPDGDERMQYSADGMNLLSKTYIDFGHPFSKVSNYQRDLVLETAEAHVRYDYDGVTYSREYFSSYPDKVTVMRFTASEEGKLSFALRPNVPFIRDYLSTPGDGKGKSGKVTAEGDTITLSGTMHYFGINFEAQYKVIPTGGKLTAKNGSIQVENADSAVVILAVGTNYKMSSETFTANTANKLDRSEFPHEKVSGYLAEASKKSYEDLKKAHRTDFQEYFCRVELELGGQLDNAVTTDTLLKKYKAGNYDPYIEELVFQYGRYLLIASSREGCLPANLQGIWNYYESVAWSGGYVHNINIQMNYWPAFSTNLMELFQSYADYNVAMRDVAESHADNYLVGISSPYTAALGTGENGWALGAYTYPCVVNPPVTNTHSGPGIGAFTSLLFWDYYDYTRDGKILEEYTYPAVEGMAKFLSKTLKEYEDRKWLVYNSASPENAKNYRTVGTAFDQQMIYENHMVTLLAAKLLGYSEEDYPILTTIRQQINHLDPVNVGASGQVKEYREENYYGEIGEYQHRHISQMVGLYPGTSITSETDAWLDAAKVSLTNRGDGTVGWDIAHRLLCWARAEDAEQSYHLVQHLITKSISYNLWNSYPPFQIDGNFGFTAGVAEMLIQGHEGYIQLLPALPEAWSTGSYKGLTTRGNFEVDAAWENGQATQFQITSRAGSDCALVYPNIANAVITDSKGKSVSFTAEGTDKISFATTKGESYTVTQIPTHSKVDHPKFLNYTVSGNALELTWEASKDAVSYNVYQAVNDQPTYELVASGITETAYSHSLANTQSSDRLTIKVTAVDKNGRESLGITALRNAE